MIQEINAMIDGHPQALHLEPGQYNGHKVYYLLDDDIAQRFHHALPDNLVLMENGDGFTCSPRLSEMEGGYIALQIWNAIKQADIA